MWPTRWGTDWNGRSFELFISGRPLYLKTAINCLGTIPSRETVSHFLFECPAYGNERQHLDTALGCQNRDLKYIMSKAEHTHELLRYVVRTQPLGLNNQALLQLLAATSHSLTAYPSRLHSHTTETTLEPHTSHTPILFFFTCIMSSSWSSSITTLPRPTPKTSPAEYQPPPH